MVKGGENASFVDEALSSPGEIGFVGGGDGNDGLIVDTCGEIDGEKFLEGDETLESCVLGEIGDAEAALSEDALNPIRADL